MNDEIRRLAERARAQLSQTKGKALESSELKSALRKRITVAEAKTRVSEVVNESAADPATTVAVATADVAAAATRALEKVEAGNESNLTEHEYVALEAIVQLTGRPAMRYTDGRVDMPPNAMGENERWRVWVVTARSLINAASSSVAQVAKGGGAGATLPVGTAWRLGADLVVTNRHVAFELASNPGDPRSQWKLDAGKQPILDFNATDTPTFERRMRLEELLYCSEEDEVDLAVMRFVPAGPKIPPPLDLDFDAAGIGRDIDAGGGRKLFQGEAIYVVGHPFRQFASAESASVFGNADASKRCSPGEVTTLSTTNTRVFEHDCSTLGGNSGSCVLHLETHAVVGLHYAGAAVNPLTGMGRANLAIGLALLGDHPAAKILKAGRVA